MKKIYLFIFAFLISIIVVNSSAICINKQDEFVIKCTLEDKYFIQDFTCLNFDCSTKILNKGEYQELLIDNSQNATIFNNYIKLTDVYKDLSILNNLCEEKFSQNELLKLDEITKDYFSTPIKSYSGNKHTIEPNFKYRTEELAKIKENKEKDFENCYTIEYEIYDTIIIKKNIRKNYCTINYNLEKDCFQTNLDKEKYGAFLITNPHKTYNIILIYAIFTIIIISSIIFIYKIKQEKKLKEFLKPTKNKLLFKLILMIPIFYFIGIIINYIVNKKYYFFMTIWLEIIIILISSAIIYFLSGLIEYYFIEKK